jgi:hypothetical protein
MRALALSLILALPVVAQPGPQTAAQPLERASDVPDAQKVRRTAQALARMRDLHKQVMGKQEEARNTRDVIKLNCVNEKVTQVKGLLRISEQADASMQEAIAKQERASADHEFTKISIAVQKVEQLRGEVEECIGQLAFRTGEMLVEVEEPDGLPDDPTDPQAPGPVISRPPPASPVL